MTGSLETAQWVLRAVLATIFVFMGTSHFVPGPARAMAAMIPATLKRVGWPSAKALVRFTGVCELAGGIGLLVPATQFAAGIALVLFLFAVFPANAVAAANPAKFGRAAIPFWPRLFAQLGLALLLVLAAI